MFRCLSGQELWSWGGGGGDAACILESSGLGHAALGPNHHTDRGPTLPSDVHALLQPASVRDAQQVTAAANPSSLPSTLTKGNLVGGRGSHRHRGLSSVQHPGSRESQLRQTGDAASGRRGKSGSSGGWSSKAPGVVREAAVHLCRCLPMTAGTPD